MWSRVTGRRKTSWSLLTYISEYFLWATSESVLLGKDSIPCPLYFFSLFYSTNPTSQGLTPSPYLFPFGVIVVTSEKGHIWTLRISLPLIHTHKAENSKECFTVAWRYLIKVGTTSKWESANSLSRSLIIWQFIRH